MEETLRQDLKQAQLERDEIKVATLRLLLSEITNAKIQKGTESLEDKDIVILVQREVKKRNEAAAGFRSGNREDAAEKEEDEAKILLNYLPEQLSTEELTKIVDTTINELGATSMSDMGKVMGSAMGKVGQNAPSQEVSALVKERLSQS